MEESLVLDVGQPSVVQEIAEHERAGLVLHARLLEELLRRITALVASLTTTIRVVIVIEV